MDMARWMRFVPLIEKHSLQPILAIVPDNLDHKLDLAPPNPHFWELMRAMEADGATIGLHGYQHRCENAGRSLVPLHQHSEFAGVRGETQRQWIHCGLQIVRSNGLNPRVWVAPRHGFDRRTLWALRKEGIGILSDGMGRVAHRRGGVVWLPQQLWTPQPRRCGLWTICLHSNLASHHSVEALTAFLRSHAAQFTSVDRVLEEHQPGRRGLMETLYAGAQMSYKILEQKYKYLRRSYRQRRWIF
jgi:predicted deacetylase